MLCTGTCQSGSCLPPDLCDGCLQLPDGLKVAALGQLLLDDVPMFSMGKVGTLWGKQAAIVGKTNG